MAKSYADRTTFWMREYELPLFWLTDPNQTIFKPGTLALFKDSVTHYYYLDGSELLVAEAGKALFSSKAKTSKYLNEIHLLLQEVKEERRKYDQVNFSKLTPGGLHKAFVEILKFLSRCARIYARTESFNWHYLEAQLDKYQQTIAEIGKLRFKMRKEGEPILYDLLERVMVETARRFEEPVNALMVYTFEEIQALFAGKKPRSDIIKARLAGYVWIIKGASQQIHMGKRFDHLYQELVAAHRDKKVFVGRTASKGLVTGRVQLILHNQRNIDAAVATFQSGNILVTEMTRPATLAACMRAAAIVTDEGGVTSHAAIISRELGIPCVVGVKHATQALSDGDVVEVDANNGKVTLIAKK